MINWAQLKQQAGPWADAYVARLEARTATWNQMIKETEEWAKQREEAKLQEGSMSEPNQEPEIQETK